MTIFECLGSDQFLNEPCCDKIKSVFLYKTAEIKNSRNRFTENMKSIREKNKGKEGGLSDLGQRDAHRRRMF